jgi:hypothetical protein
MNIMNTETLKAQLDAALRENLMIQIGVCDHVSLDILDAIAEQNLEPPASLPDEPIQPLLDDRWPKPA